MSARSLRMLRRLALFAAVLFPTLLLASDALARPGGGHGFSGGGGGGGFGGGGSGGGGDATGLIIWLLIAHPRVGIPVIIVVLILSAVSRKASRGRRDWSTTRPTAGTPAAARPSLERIRGVDPDFSTVLFEDFLYALYAKAHEARGRGALDAFSAYLAGGARAALQSLQPPASEVKGVIVGAMDVLSVTGFEPSSARIDVSVRFRTNYTEVYPDGREQTWYVVEQWLLSRSRAARSRPPERARVFGCPNCGGALEPSPDGVCPYCHTRVDTGDFDWVATSIATLQRTAQGPNLTQDVPERGTDLPTVRARDVEQALQALLDKDPSFDLEAFGRRVRRIHHEINEAWSSRKWERARPWLSDALFASQLYWIETYRRAGLRNVTENARVTGVELSRVTSDRWYDAITVRLFATGLDYTIADADGRVLTGSRTRERPYSEYWTLIRAQETSGAAKSEASCPRCGAPLDRINMAGVCEYCGAKVTTGEFDWVLSRIEQDDVYGL